MSRVDELMALVDCIGNNVAYGYHKAQTCPQSAHEYYDKARKAREELRTALSACVGEWLPISEAPRDGTTVLLYLGPEHRGYGVHAGYFYAETDGQTTWVDADCNHAYTHNPTHYQSLQQPPETP